MPFVDLKAVSLTYRLGKERILDLRARAEKVAPGPEGRKRFHLLFMQQGTIPAVAIALNKATTMSLFMTQLSLMDYPRTHPDHVGKVRTMMATAAAIQSTMRLKRCTRSTPRVAHIEPGSHTSAGRFRYVM